MEDEMNESFIRHAIEVVLTTHGVRGTNIQSDVARQRIIEEIFSITRELHDQYYNDMEKIESD